MEATPRRIEAGRVINESFELYREHPGPLISSALIIFVIVGLAQALLAEAGGTLLSLIGSIISLVGHALYTGVVVRLVENVRAHGRRDTTTGELFSTASPAIPRLIGNGILKGIAVGIGFVLLIIPGLFLLTIWAVTSPAIVVERRGAIEAFGRSYELVREHGWQVFGAILLAFLIGIGIALVAVGIGLAIGVVGVIVLTILAAVLTAPIPALVSSILFFDLGGGQRTPEVATAPPPPPAPAV